MWHLLIDEQPACLHPLAGAREGHWPVLCQAHSVITLEVDLARARAAHPEALLEIRRGMCPHDHVPHAIRTGQGCAVRVHTTLESVLST